MELKKTGIVRELTSARDRISSLVKALGARRPESSVVSRPTPMVEDTRYEPLNLLTNYTLYYELKKAEGIGAWRRLQDKPK